MRRRRTISRGFLDEKGTEAQTSREDAGKCLRCTCVEREVSLLGLVTELGCGSRAVILETHNADSGTKGRLRYKRAPDMVQVAYSI